MSYGILLDYRDDDDTLMGLQVAQFIEQCGGSVSVAACSSKLHKVHPDWDSRCFKLTLGNVDQWLADKTTLISAHNCPILSRRVVKAKEATIIRLLQCDALGEFSKKSTRPEANWFVCPSTHFAKILTKNLKVPNVLAVPWCHGLPITRKKETPSGQPVRMLLPLYGDNARRVSVEILGLIPDLVRHSNVHLTIAYSRTSAAYSRRLLMGISERADGKISLSYNDPWDKRLLLFGKHDLTIMPFVIDGSGLATMQSLHMGTAVMAFNIAPICEYIEHAGNGILVPTEFNFDKAGLPVAKPDYRLFEQQIAAIVKEPKILTMLNQRSSEHLAEKNRQFCDTWSKLLNLD